MNFELNDDRAASVSRVLVRVFFLNLVVAAAKIVLGYVTGAISILSDGFHSLTDTAANVVALIGVRLSAVPPDADHPYGHRKYETMASVGILVFLVIILLEVLTSAVERIRAPAAPDLGPLTFPVMAVTFTINALVVWYEGREGRRLSSEVLIADAHHTRSDLLTTATVIGALIGVGLGYGWLDAAAALVIAGFIAMACWEILALTTRILSDRIVVDETTIRRVVESVPNVLGCHHIRTRGSEDFAFLDLHIWLDPALRLDEAHRLSHVVKARLMEELPQIKDVVIHIEPPPESRL